MDFSQMNSIAATTGASAKTVASALARPTSAGQPTAKSATTGTSGAGSTSSNPASNAASISSDITANDFLTLLVSELKNQDPTQPTDPNAYISQLVGVNSLQQLISINSGLTSIENPTTPSTSSPPATPVSGGSSS